MSELMIDVDVRTHTSLPALRGLYTDDNYSYIWDLRNGKNFTVTPTSMEGYFQIEDTDYLLHRDDMYINYIYKGIKWKK